MLVREFQWACRNCGDNVWGDEILDNDWCKHDFPFNKTFDNKDRKDS